MLKINLSGDKDEHKEETDVETEVQSETPTMSDEAYDDAVPPEMPKSSKLSAGQVRSLILLAILAVVVLIYFNKDTIFGLFGGRGEPIQQVAPPPPPPQEPEPEPASEPKQPDPTFVALGGIGEAVPPRVWLSSAVIMFDGTYEIKGIAFSHESIAAMIASLGKIGSLTAQNIPKKSPSSETVYNFSASGVFSGIAVPEILDVIPADNLATLAESVKSRSEEYGVSFLRLPKSGQTYTEKDMPFVLEGSFMGLTKVIADLCPEGGSTKVYRIVINPAAPGKVFDKIRASFAIKTVSTI